MPSFHQSIALCRFGEKGATDAPEEGSEDVSVSLGDGNAAILDVSMFCSFLVEIPPSLPMVVSFARVIFFGGLGFSSGFFSGWARLRGEEGGEVGDRGEACGGSDIGVAILVIVILIV